MANALFTHTLADSWNHFLFQQFTPCITLNNLMVLFYFIFSFFRYFPPFFFSLRDIGEAIGRVAKTANCSIVTTYCGHGVGQLFHTAPNIPHYPNNKAKGTMKARLSSAICSWHSYVYMHKDACMS